MSSLFEWLVSLGPGPWAFGIAAIAGGVFATVTLARMYWKFRDREAERRSRERMERIRRASEREHRRDMHEMWRIMDESMNDMYERDLARRSREDADAEEGDLQG